MTDENVFFTNILKNCANDAAGQKAVRSFLHDSDIKAHGRDIPFSFIPLLLNDGDMEFFARQIKTISDILYKVTAHYIEDKSYRKLFGFSPELEKLILLPCSYEELLPVGRYDLFLDHRSGDFQFCEFNTDGSGGMSRDLEISKKLLDTESFRLLGQGYELSVVNSIENITDSLVAIYKTDRNAIEHPLFAITDFREEGVFSDFDRFIECFKSKGYEARFTDIRDFALVAGKLIDKTDGRVVNAVYRRAVTSVVLARLGECREFIRACEENAAVVLGHFRTSVVHSKAISVVLRREETFEFLTESEKKFILHTIPETYFLTGSGISENMKREFLQNREEWIIKPIEGFGSASVLAGVDVSDSVWRQQFDSAMGNGGFLIQRFCPRGTMNVLDTTDNKIKTMALMLGIYISGKSVAGFYSRAGNGGIIDFNNGGLCVSTLRCRKKK